MESINIGVNKIMDKPLDAIFSLEEISNYFYGKKLRVWVKHPQLSHPKIKFEKVLPNNYECFFDGTLKRVASDKHLIGMWFLFDDVDFPMRKKTSKKKSWDLDSYYIEKWCLLD